MSVSLPLSTGTAPPLRATALRPLIDRVIALIDAAIGRQLDRILHHPRMQALEAAWRGLALVVERAGRARSTKVRVLDAGWDMICRDFERAVEFDRAEMFAKIYEDEFGSPGGEPFGVLIGAYELMHLRDEGHPTDDVTGLKGMATVAAAAFAPFIAGAHPRLLGLDRFEALGRGFDPGDFESADHVRWRGLRMGEDARFLGLTCPRILLRRPWGEDPGRIDGFRYVEDVSGPDAGKYLWGVAAFAFALVLIRAHDATGWFADIRGAARDHELGGLVRELPADHFGTDRPDVGLKPPVDVQLTDAQDKRLADLGLIALAPARDTPWVVFHGNPSLQLARPYDREAASANARLSAMLQYMLCVSRFAHYVKVIGRDRVGSFSDAAACEEYLRRWLLGYSIASDTATPEQKARYPLRECAVSVRESPGRPGIYDCTIHLRPHFQLDEVSSGFRLVTWFVARGLPRS